MRKKMWLAGLLAAVLVFSPFAGTLKASASTVSGGDSGSTVSSGDSESPESGSVVIDGKEYFFANGEKIQGHFANSGIEGYLFDEGTIFYVTKPGRGMATGGDAPASSVKKFVLADGIESIGQAAFGDVGAQVQVTSIEIPASVKSIGSYAFFGWSKLTEIKFLGEVETIGQGAFMGYKDDGAIETTVIVQNDVEKSYDWAKDYRTVTIIDQRASEQSGESSGTENGSESGSGSSENVSGEDATVEDSAEKDDGEEDETETVMDMGNGVMVRNEQNDNGEIRVSTSGQEIETTYTVPAGSRVKKADGTEVLMSAEKLVTYIASNTVDSGIRERVLNPVNARSKEMRITTDNPYTIDITLVYDGEIVPELTNAITFTIEIPQSANVDFSKPVAVVRVHNGVSEFLDTTVNAAERKVSFQTDGFSVYAVVNVGKISPKTGETRDYAVEIILLMGGILVMGTAVMYAVKKTGKEI